MSIAHSRLVASSSPAGPTIFPCRCFDRAPVECPHNPARAQGGAQPHWLSDTHNDYAAKLKQAASPAALWRTLQGGQVQVNPVEKRQVSTADLLGYLTARSPLGAVLMLLIQPHPDRSSVDLRRISR